MERNLLAISRLNAAALIAAALSLAAVFRIAGGLSTLAAAALLAVGAAVAILSSLQLWLRKKEAIERVDLQLLKKKTPEGALFDSNPDNLRAQRVRQQFERFVLPTLTLLLALLAGAGLAWILRRFQSPAPIHIHRLPLSLTVHGVIAFASFVLGKYSAGIARHEGHTLLRPAASWLLVGALANCLCLLASTAVWFAFPRADLAASLALAATLALFVLETVVQLVLEFYRPRLHNQDAHPVYESRLLGLLSQPASLIHTVAHTLDYQFGFKVSETWFYQFLERRLPALLGLQIALLWASTSLVFLEPHQQALLLRFGAPVPSRSTLQPGIHFKFPWPIDSADIHSTRSIRSFDVGFVPDPALAQNDTLLWTREHYKEELHMLVASNEESPASPQPAGSDLRERSVPVNLLTVSIPIQYHITNLAQWTRTHSAPESVLSILAHREVSHYLVSVDLHHIMSAGRARAAADLKQRLQISAAEGSLGVEILFVGLQDVHPPVPVADAYEAVVAAAQERETRILDALGYESERIPRAAADAFQRVEMQRAQSTGRRFTSQAQADRFRHQRAAWQASPAVYQTRAYHDALVRALAPARKFILSATNAQEQFWFNFEEKLRTDLLDVPVPPPRPKSGNNP